MSGKSARVGARCQRKKHGVVRGYTIFEAVGGVLRRWTRVAVPLRRRALQPGAPAPHGFAASNTVRSPVIGAVPGPELLPGLRVGVREWSRGRVLLRPRERGPLEHAL